MSIRHDPVLAQEVRTNLRRYGDKAVFYKAAYQWTWFLVTVCVWITLLLAIIGLAWPDMGGCSDLVLHWVIPGLSVLVTLGSVAQTVFQLRTKWTSYRAAAEHLKNACMNFRAGLMDSYDFANRVHRIHERAGRGEQFKRNYLFSYLFGLPPDLLEKFPDLANEGIIPDPADAAQEKRLTPEDVIEGRLQHQRKWMIPKMQKYRIMFAIFELAVVLISLFNGGFVWYFGRHFLWVALTTTISLAIIACRDFLDLDRLILQYLDAASALEDIKKQYAAVDLSEQGRLKDLVSRVESVLSHESQAWYHQHAGPVAIEPGPLDAAGS
ncbi:MAG: DUF4231 domain-containing protein [Planctomycetes bacterium]|nr:DUF4231 domain-containing protein [Planctomycetota bacterium]